MATVTPNFNWPVPTSTDLVKDGATAIEALGDSIDGAFVDLKGGTTGQVLAKATNTDLDFAWVAQDDSNAIQNAIVDAKGDLIAASGADTPARLAVGANGETLVADNSTATGLDWKSATEQYPWQTFTPTNASITVGNGTVVAKYQQIGKLINFHYRLTLGTTSSIAADPYITLPAAQAYSGYIYLEGLCFDQNINGFVRSIAIGVGSSAYLYPIATSGTYASAAPASSTIPFTWTSGDTLTIYGSYEAV